MIRNFFFLICILLLGYKVAAQTEMQPVAVVELFTSAGCNKCPTADSVLQKIADEARLQKKNVVTIAYHVDYWNKPYKDPYSKNQFTYLQQNYVSVLQLKEMYTPMMVVNGAQTATGNNFNTGWSLIAKQLQKPANNSLSLTPDSIINDTLYVSYLISKQTKNTSIKILLLENNLHNQIPAGQNKGLTLQYNYVCRIYKAKSIESKKGQIAIALKGLKLNPNISLVGLLQQRGSLQIDAAFKGTLTK